MPSKKHIFWITVLALGLGSGLSLAASTPVSTPMVPAQNTAAIAPLEIEPNSSLSVVVKEVQGQASVKEGDVLHSGDTVKTEEGSCRLLIDGKAELDLAPFTTLRITEALRNDQEKTDSTRLTVDFGRMKVRLPKLKAGSTFEVNTPTSVAVVRGTTFYLNISNLLAQLYVDESQGGVLFKNIATGKSFLVPAFSFSTSYGDGTINEPKELTKEQQEAFIKNWQDPASSALQQFGVEEVSTLPAAPFNVQAFAENDLSGHTNDALQDRLSEPRSEPSPEPQPESTPEPEPTLEPTIDDQEQAMIRQEIARIRGDQDFDHADANLERISDTKSGKVFTDVFGNRVRTDQYIFMDPGTGLVQFLSLTARAGEYQNGVSSLLFGTLFNQPISADTELRSLPWNDYMNVVTKDEVAANLGIQIGTPEYDALFDEYILHEHNAGLAQGATALYPILFIAQFTNPNQDSVTFGNVFTTPFSLDLQFGDGSQSFLAQGRLAESTLVAPASGPTVQLIGGYQAGEAISTDGGLTFVPFVDDSDGGDGGSQTAAFAANFDPSKLLDINYYRDLAVNNDGNPLNDEHPAYFDTRLNDRLDGSNAVIGRNHLIGGFVPINDLGQIIDRPGFTLEGVRDLLSPNPLVNEGNYNLEVALLYGYVDNTGTNGVFHEDFRIDMIIAPEIFTDFYSQQSSTPSIFPASLLADDDDNNSGPSQI